jgi:transcriptional regulator with XRE-family HTH domain
LPSVQRRNPQAVIEAVGRRIAEVRQHHGLTQEKAAERLGISLRHMKRIEAGHNMTLFTLARIAFALDVTPASLLAAPRSSAPRRPGRPRAS